MRAASLSLPAGQIRDVDRAAELWGKLGHTPRSVRAYRQWTLQILGRAQVSDYRQLSVARVVRLARSFARTHGHGDPQRTRWRWLSAFRAFAWGLQQLGIAVGSTRLPPRGRVPEPVVLTFLEYGQRLGWAPQTLRIHRRHLDHLRRYLVRHRASWPVPRLADIDRFLHAAARRWKRSTVAGAAGTFRAWHRFLFITGRCKHDLAASIALPPSISYSRPARALSWSLVRRMRKGIQRSTAIGRRDYAQYLLFCAYGLSNAEIINLRLEQIDWKSGILHIRRVKNGTTLDLPLLPAVASAMAAYLQHGRPPQAVSRHVFVRHTIPYCALGHATVGQRIQCWARRANVRAPFLGAHLFRHSFATRQLERGLPLKVIGDLLGHRHCQTTGVYVRTALARLRRLALPVPV